MEFWDPFRCELQASEECIGQNSSLGGKVASREILENIEVMLPGWLGTWTDTGLDHKGLEPF